MLSLLLRRALEIDFSERRSVPDAAAALGCLARMQIFSSFERENPLSLRGPLVVESSQLKEDAEPEGAAFLPRGFAGSLFQTSRTPTPRRRLPAKLVVSAFAAATICQVSGPDASDAEMELSAWKLYRQCNALALQFLRRVGEELPLALLEGRAAGQEVGIFW